MPLIKKVLTSKEARNNANNPKNRENTHKRFQLKLCVFVACPVFAVDSLSSLLCCVYPSQKTNKDLLFLPCRRPDVHKPNIPRGFCFMNANNPKLGEHKKRQNISNKQTKPRILPQRLLSLMFCCFSRFCFVFGVPCVFPFCITPPNSKQSHVFFPFPFDTHTKPTNHIGFLFVVIVRQVLFLLRCAHLCS